MHKFLVRHIVDEYPGIARTSKVMGTSLRTFQRKLTRAGTSYTEIVQQVRYNIACEMLCDSNMRVIEVANALGYEDSSHFARFFRNIAGVTPRHFRRLHQAFDDSGPERDAKPG